MSSNEERQKRNRYALLESESHVSLARKALGAEGVKSGQCRAVLNVLDSVAGTISLFIHALPEPVNEESQDTSSQEGCLESDCDGDVECECGGPECPEEPKVESVS